MSGDVPIFRRESGNGIGDGISFRKGGRSTVPAEAPDIVRFHRENQTWKARQDKLAVLQEYEGEDVDTLLKRYANNLSLHTVPALAVMVYRQDPTIRMDTLSRLRNLLFADSMYLKMEYDYDYLDTYNEITIDLEQEGERLKPYMLALGVGMMASTPLNPAMAVWGFDIISQTLWSTSVWDTAAHGVMRFANWLTQGRAFDEHYIGNFSLFHITHDEGLNLFLQEALSEVLSFGISAAARYVGHSVKARWFGIVDDAMDSSGSRWSRILGKGLAGDLYNVLTSDTPWYRKALCAAWALTKEYVELVGEVVFEMSFDNMLRLDPSERPLGGGEMFLTLMTLYTVTRAGIDGRFEPGSLDTPDLTAGKRALDVFSKGLLVGQMFGMTPVLLANSPQLGIPTMLFVTGVGLIPVPTLSGIDIRTDFRVLYHGLGGTILLPMYYLDDILFTGSPIFVGG